MRLIFASIELNAPKPLPIGLPANPKTIGEHIRKVRMERGLFQKDVAKIIGVETCTLENWERNRTKPFLELLPSIFGFLGYVPEVYKDDLRLQSDILKYRAKYGLGVKAMANLIGVNKSTIFGWETGRFEMSDSLIKRFERICNR